MASLIGKEIKNYRITERIGRGGMAEVYRGVHVHLDSPVAIKVLHGYLVEGGDFIKRFNREAKAVARLRHPNIVRVYDLDFQDEIIFMVMDHIDGVSLAKRIKELNQGGVRLPTKQIVSILNDIAGALDYAHSKGMLHRDVKPANILIDKEGKAYLVDFGIAKIIGDQKLTITGGLIGTPEYMSPEQSRGDELTNESDIYSLGIVAFEMLTGQIPYDAQTDRGIVEKQISEPVPEISDLVDDLPASVQEVIEKALAKSPAGRYSSAEDLVGALKIALMGLEPDTELEPEPASKEGDGDILSGPTVLMPGSDDSDEFDKPTELMDEDSGADQKDVGSPPAKKAEKGRTAEDGSKRKILTRGLIMISVALVGVVALVGLVVVFGGVAMLTQAIDLSSPGSESEPNFTGSEILFQDDFSSNTHDWIEGDRSSNDYGEIFREVVDGKYRLSLRALDIYYVVFTPVPEFRGKDFLFSIDATIVDMSAGPGDFVLQFNFREADGIAGKHYSFRFYNDGYVDGQLWSTGSSDSIETILDLTKHPAVTLEQGVTNRFSFRLQGNDFTLYVNGEEVATVRDTTIDEEGNISIGMSLIEPDDTLTIEFDNLVIEGMGANPGISDTSKQPPAEAEPSGPIAAITPEPAETPIDPLIVSLGNDLQSKYVTFGTPVILRHGVVADTQDLLQENIAAWKIEVNLDGQPLTNVDAYWGEVEQAGDRDFDGDEDYISYWYSPVGVLSAGTHAVESKHTKQWEVWNGLDFDGDGLVEKDLWPSSYEYSLTIIVEE